MRILQSYLSVLEQIVEQEKRILLFIVDLTMYIRKEIEVMLALDLLIVAS